MQLSHPLSSPAQTNPAAEANLRAAVDSLNPSTLAAMLDPVMRYVLESGFVAAHADEGTLWLLDEDAQFLVPCFNTGPNAEKFVGKFRQPSDSGLISMVVANEQPFLENDVHQNARQSKLLDSLLGLQTDALLAVPWDLFGRCRGVVSCVQLKRAPSDPSRHGFDSQHLAHVQHAAAILSRLLEAQFLKNAFGLGRQSEWTR